LEIQLFHGNLVLGSLGLRHARFDGGTVTVNNEVVEVEFDHGEEATNLRFPDTLHLEAGDTLLLRG
jgi:hypothetical protein